MTALTALAAMLIPSIDPQRLKALGRQSNADALHGVKLDLPESHETLVCDGCHFSAATDTGSSYFVRHFFDDKKDASVLLCPLCRGIFQAESFDNNFHVIFYPWLKQSEINLITNLLISCLSRPSSEYHETCRMLYDHMSCFGGQYLFDQMLDQGLASSADLSAALSTLYRKHPEVYSRRGELLGGVRVLPDLSAFESKGKVWVNEWPGEHEWQGLAEAWEQQAK